MIEGIISAAIFFGISLYAIGSYHALDEDDQKVDKGSWKMASKAMAILGIISFIMTMIMS